MGRAGRRGVEFGEHDLTGFFGQVRPECRAAGENAQQVRQVRGVAGVVDHRRPKRIPKFDLVNLHGLYHRARPGMSAADIRRQRGKELVDLPAEEFDLFRVQMIVGLAHPFQVPSSED